MRKLLNRKMFFLYHRPSGFTLIELLMTIVVVGIVAVPLSLLISRHIEAVFVSEDFTIGYNLARLEMEKVNNMLYQDILNASFTNYEGNNYNVARTVAYAQGTALTAESLKKITVSVTKPGSGAVLASLISYIAKDIAYGI